MLLQRRSPRRVVAGAAAVITISAVVLLPWTAYLAVTLPPSVTARNWPLAWTGLDAVMVAGLAMTGVLAIRRDRRVAFVAASTATVLLADAWFDVCTSAAGRPLALALADMAIEVGEAACCVLLAWAVWRDPLPRSDQSGTLSQLWPPLALLGWRVEVSGIGPGLPRSLTMSTSPQGWQYPQYPQGPVTPTALVRSMRPARMQRAITLMYAGAAAGAVSAIVDGLTAQHTMFYIYTSSSSSNVQHAIALASGIISAVIVAGLWLWMAWKTGAGRPWARVLSSVFFGFQCLGMLGAIVSLFGSGASVPGFVLTLAERGIGLAALVLLWQPESSQFFASAQHQKRAAAYGAAPPGYPPPGYGQPPQYGQYGQPPQYGQPGYGEPPR